MTVGHPLQRFAGSAVIMALMCASMSACASYKDVFAYLQETGRNRPNNQASLSEREEADYASARAAIDRKDYGTALEWLQRARLEVATDVRIYNALGVIYDKLGRFDLSQKYYEHALTLDPSSDIVQRNVAYSTQLQTKRASLPDNMQALEVAVVKISPAASGALLENHAPDLQLAPAGRRGLTIANATGDAAIVHKARSLLKGLGWRPGSAAALSAPKSQATTVHYRSDFQKCAVALSRTLPGHPKTVADESSVDGLMLVLGSDVRTWAPRKLKTENPVG